MNRHGNHGFTLIELLMVIVIIGTLTGILVPRIDVAHYQVNSVVQALSTTMAAAQREAITKQHDIILTFDDANREVRLVWDADSDGDIDLGERVKAVPVEERVMFGLGGAPARPFGEEAINFNKVVDGLPALTFHRNGSASGVGGFYLTTVAAQNGAGDRSRDTRAVEIVRATGRTEWWRFNGSEWIRGF
jgi:prepilin-type N-terminal cleavage/methylation domain-containing protein